MIRPLTVPSTVVNAMAEMIANSSSLKLLASSGAAMLVLVDVERAAGHRAEAEEQREHVEEADAAMPTTVLLRTADSSLTV